MRIRYTPAARQDLLDLRTYLTSEFGLDVAAKAVSNIVLHYLQKQVTFAAVLKPTPVK